MLQRVQTIFLFLVAGVMVLFLLFPIWVYENTEIHRLQAYGLYSLNNSTEETLTFWPYAVSGILGLAVLTNTLIEMFSFKNRLIQLKLGALNSFLLAATLITSVWFATDIKSALTLNHPGMFGLSLFFPAIAMICNLVANRFIRKDENLVRSMDRIR